MYLVPASRGCAEFEIKRSRFIALVEKATNREQALLFVETIRSEYPDARHVCYAFKTGDASNPSEMAFNDDGEPSGTAGKPILNVLQHSDIGDVVAVVVRYFGGIKLGAGGLVRAYSNAVSGALAEIPTQPYENQVIQTLQVDYALESAIRHLLEKYGATLIYCEYNQKITLQWSIGESQQSIIENAVQQIDHRLSLTET